MLVTKRDAELSLKHKMMVLLLYWYVTQKLSGTAQKNAQKEEKSTQKEERINTLLEYCKEPRDRDEMMKFLGVNHRTIFRSNYLNPLLDDGKIAMTISDKPCSKNQKNLFGLTFAK